MFLCRLLSRFQVISQAVGGRPDDVISSLSAPPLIHILNFPEIISDFINQQIIKQIITMLPGIFTECNHLKKKKKIFISKSQSRSVVNVLAVVTPSVAAACSQNPN